MKKYRRYMNGVKAPDTLHRRLRELKAPEKKPAPWARYGAMAAALVLVFGGASVGLHWNAQWSGYLESLFQKASYVPEADAADPDIAWEDPGDVTEPGEKTLGGYDVREERGGVAVVCHYILPYIEYGEVEPRVDLDWDIPEGATRRDLTQDEIVALMGGEDVLSTHLDWGDEYVLIGWAAWYEDGSFWGAYINGVWPNYGRPASQFEFAVTAGQLPPTCYGYPSSVTQEIRGLTVTADKFDWEDMFDEPVYVHERRVSFMKDDYGYRFEMSSGDPDMAEEMVSRLVCRIADAGLALTYTCPYCGHTFPFGAVHNDPFIGADATYTCDVCGNTFPVGTVHNDPDVTRADDGESFSTQPYDPAGPVSVSDAPAASEEICGYPLAPDTHICEVCGESIPDGMAHDCAMCDGYPVPHVCEICGEVYPEGTAHSHEICGYPLAPDTRTCPECGESYAAGTAHTCRQGSHHQEQHHENHH